MDIKSAKLKAYLDTISDLSHELDYIDSIEDVLIKVDAPSETVEKLRKIKSEIKQKIRDLELEY